MLISPSGMGCHINSFFSLDIWWVQEEEKSTMQNADTVQNGFLCAYV